MEKLRRRCLDYENSNPEPKSGQIMSASTSINLWFLQHCFPNLCTKFTNINQHVYSVHYATLYVVICVYELKLSVWARNRAFNPLPFQVMS